MPLKPDSVTFASFSTATDSSIVDRDAVLDRVGGDEELLREIIGIFFEEYPVIMAEIRDAAAQHAAANLESAAHSLKGAVANFGARAATGLARDLELLGRQRELRGLAPLVSSLDRELALLHRALLGLLRNDGNG